MLVKDWLSVFKSDRAIRVIIEAQSEVEIWKL